MAAVAMTAAAMCLLGSAIAGGWAAYERWWRSCVAEDPLAATCLATQDNSYLDAFRASADGIATLAVAYGLQYVLLGAACLLVPFAAGSDRAIGLAGLCSAYCFAALAVLMASQRMIGGSAELVFVTAPALFAYCAPLLAVLAVGWGGLRDLGLSPLWPVTFAVIGGAGTPILDEFLWPRLLLGEDSHDTNPWTGASTAVAAALAALVIARVALFLWRAVERTGDGPPDPEPARHHQRMTHLSAG